VPLTCFSIFIYLFILFFFVNWGRNRIMSKVIIIKLTYMHNLNVWKSVLDGFPVLSTAP